MFLKMLGSQCYYLICAKIITSMQHKKNHSYLNDYEGSHTRYWEVKVQKYKY